MFISLITLSSTAFGFDRMASEISLNADDRFTVEYRRLHTEVAVSSSDSELVKRLKLEMNKCGVSTTESACLGSEFESKKSPFSYKFNGLNGARYLIKGMHKHLNSQLMAVQVIKIHVENKIRVFDKVEVFQSNANISSNFFNQFFKSYANGELTPLFTIEEFIPHNYEEYISKAKADENGISLFHSLFLSLRNLGDVDPSELKDLVAEKIDIISSLKDPVYQREYLKFLKEDKIFDKEMFSTGVTAYLGSKDKSVQIEAALLLGEEGISNEKSKSLIIKTLGNISISLQKRALQALFNIRTELSDDVLIIGLMKDFNKEISKLAYNLSMRMELGDDHLPQISTLFNTPDHEFRSFAVNLVNKVNTEKGKNRLIDLMTDNHPDVVKSVFNFLKLREINNDDINRFKKLLNDDREFTKFYSLYFVNKDESFSGFKAILSKISDKSDKVKGMALELLNARDFTSIDRKILNGYIDNKKSRLAALSLLNNYKDSNATKVMIRNLKNFKGDELQSLFNIIRKREFDGSEFSALKDTFRKFNKVEVRVSVIQLFTLIPSNKVLKYLKKKRRRAFSSDIKKALDTLIAHLKKTL